MVATLPQPLSLPAQDLSPAGGLSLPPEQEQNLPPTNLKCPYCQDRFRRPEGLIQCRSCQAIYHAECVHELGEGRCANLGCAGTFRPLSARQAAQLLERSRPVLLRIKIRAEQFDPAAFLPWYWGRRARMTLVVLLLGALGLWSGRGVVSGLRAQWLLPRMNNMVQIADLEGLLRYRQEEHRQIRHQLFMSLGRMLQRFPDLSWGEPRAWRKAMRLLSRASADNDPTIQRYARESLRRLGPRAASGLLAALWADTDRQALKMVRLLLPANPVRKEVMARIQRRLRQRLTAVSLLGRIRTPEVVRGLVSSLRREQSWEVRQATARALGRLGHSLAVPALLRLLKRDTELNVRLAAARALGKIGDESVVPELRRLIRPTYLHRTSQEKGPFGVNSIFVYLENSQNATLREAVQKTLRRLQ